MHRVVQWLRMQACSGAVVRSQITLSAACPCIGALFHEVVCWLPSSNRGRAAPVLQDLQVPLGRKFRCVLLLSEHLFVKQTHRFAQRRRAKQAGAMVHPTWHIYWHSICSALEHAA